jgi:L-ascorbate metabolism protein UlaG (beta-lactamase superfamily)
MNNILKVIFPYIIMMMIPFLSFSQNSIAPKKMIFWGDSASFLKAQTTYMLDLVDKTLTDNPPRLSNSVARKLALYNFDAIVHEKKYDNSEALHAFIGSRMKTVINDLAKPLQSGMKIYKVYNDGFVIRTKSTTIAIDLCGRRGTFVPDSLMRLIVNKCEALYISHNHDDHADENVIPMFVKDKKPIYAPTEVYPSNNNINHIYPEKMISEKTLLKSSKIQINIVPGHQDDLLNNIYVITFPEGFTIAHLGDQYNKNDLPSLKNIYTKIPSVDALLVDCWISNMAEIIEDFNPKIVVTGHENEMGHSIDHREPFWLTYQKMEKINKPSLIMGWGEWYLYRK